MHIIYTSTLIESKISNITVVNKSDEGKKIELNVNISSCLLDGDSDVLTLKKDEDNIDNKDSSPLHGILWCYFCRDYDNLPRLSEMNKIVCNFDYASDITYDGFVFSKFYCVVIEEGKNDKEKLKQSVKRLIASLGLLENIFEDKVI